MCPGFTWDEYMKKPGDHPTTHSVFDQSSKVCFARVPLALEWQHESLAESSLLEGVYDLLLASLAPRHACQYSCQSAGIDSAVHTQQRAGLAQSRTYALFGQMLPALHPIQPRHG